jgi:PPOX class probable F420-dependent enzyme
MSALGDGAAADGPRAGERAAAGERPGVRPAALGAGVEPGPLTEAEKREFFRRPLLARLATVSADGAPYVVPLWFEWDERDGSFRVVIREKARFVPDLLREPRVCLSIAADTPPYTRATVRGRAEIVARPGESDEWKTVARRMTARYVADVDPGYFDRTAGYPRWLVRIVPVEMTTWRGGGWSRRYLG